MYYDGENYYNRSLADEILLEYQQKMKEVLLESVTKQIEDIGAENEDLKAVNERLQEQVNEIGRRERELEYKKNNLEREVRRERLSKLMEDFEVILYKASNTTEPLPKCDKCNDKRKIEYESPLGRIMYEDCTCSRGKLVYISQAHVCCEFKIDRNGNTLNMWYKAVKDKDYDYCSYSSSEYKDKVYDAGMSFDDIDKYKTFFRSEGECQQYCDWLNTKQTLTEAQEPKHG